MNGDVNGGVNHGANGGRYRECSAEELKCIVASANAISASAFR